MRGRALVLLAVITLGSAQDVRAQKRPELHGPSQREMNAQAATRRQMAESQMAEVYLKLVAKASPSGRERLKAAQDAWARFRELDCEARAGSRGGSFHPAAMSLCLEHMADRRRGALQSELDCKEGDMGCGGVLQD
jgi:uncharacterized protein YecT (DUF1311 family)